MQIKISVVPQPEIFPVHNRDHILYAFKEDGRRFHDNGDFDEDHDETPSESVGPGETQEGNEN